jgi:hypothetical protein
MESLEDGGQPDHTLIVFVAQFPPVGDVAGSFKGRGRALCSQLGEDSTLGGLA